VLVMNNGDRLQVEIKGLDAGVLCVSFDYIKGKTQVDWSKVHHIESKQLFLVKTQDGNNYTGTLFTAETEGARPVQIEIVEDIGEKVVFAKPCRGHVSDVETLLTPVQRRDQLRFYLFEGPIRRRNTKFGRRPNIPGNVGPQAARSRLT